MITGRWGRPGEVLLDLTVEEGGEVRGVLNPGRQNIAVRGGHFDAATGRVHLEGVHTHADGTTMVATVRGQLAGRKLHLDYAFGEQSGHVEVVRVEEYRPPPLTIRDRLAPLVAAVARRVHGLSRPSGHANARRLQARGESVEAITARDAVAADIRALAELHVTTWNATYRTSRGPSVALRARQWTEVFARSDRRDFLVVLEDRTGRLIGFTWGVPHEGEFEGQLSKIYLRWEYHGLGLGRRLMAESARRFLDRGITSCILFAELSNPTLGFYDRMGGERLLDERGRFHGAYGWRDLRVLLG